MHSVPTAGAADSRFWMAASIAVGLLAWSGGVAVAGKVDVAITRTVETGSGAHGVAIDGDGRYAYITNSYADSVSVPDIEDDKVVTTVRVGKGPNGISVRP